MRYVFIPLVIGLVVFVACVNTTDTGDGVPHDQTTVLGTLYLFEDVWNNGELDTYKELLDEEDFTFYFDPEDTGGEHDIPTTWGYGEEIQAYTNLFGAVGEENVDVELDLSEVTEPEEGAATCLIEEVPYEVRVHVEEGEYEMTYIASAYLDVQLEKIADLWIITDWWDRVSWRLLGCETSWGAIKACF
jgi:hypothetical protein